MLARPSHGTPNGMQFADYLAMHEVTIINTKEAIEADSYALV